MRLFSATKPLIRYEGLKNASYFLIQTRQQFDVFWDEAMSQPVLAIDTETSGTRWVKDHVCGVSIGWGPDNNYYLPIDHRCSLECCNGGRTHEKQLNFADIFEALKQLFGRNTDKILWNAKFDMHFLKNLGLDLGGKVHDGLVSSYLLDENVDHGLKEMSDVFYGPTASKWEKEKDKWLLSEGKRRKLLFTALIKSDIAKLTESDPFKAKVESLLRKANILPGVKSYKTLFKKQCTQLAKLLNVKQMAAEKYSDSVLALNKKSEISWDFVPLEVMTPYAASDVHYAWDLHFRNMEQIEKHAASKRIYDHEMLLLRDLFDMERGGMKVNRQYLVDAGPKLDEEIRAAEEIVYEAIGYRFNMNSKDELMAALRKAGVKLTKITKGSAKKLKDGVVEKKGPQLAVDKDVLEKAAVEFPFAHAVLEFRSREKVKSTYQEPILRMLDDNDYLHTNVNQNVSTGRMSGNAPNLTNIPARDKTVRKAFIVSDAEEFIYVLMDMSQIELRLTAHHSQDPVLVDAYTSTPNKDVHSITCAEVVVGILLEELKAWEHDTEGHLETAAACPCRACMYEFFRLIAKRVNFGIIYGAGPDAIQRQVSTPTRFVSRDDCEMYIEKYLKKYQGVDSWIKSIHARLAKDGYVPNTFGRYRRLPDAMLRSMYLRGRAQRQGVNFIIQSDAADVFKTGIVRVNDIFRKYKARSRLVNLVHDEMQFYWAKDELELMGEVKRAMEAFDFRVPLVADVSYSVSDWASKKKVKL